MPNLFEHLLFPTASELRFRSAAYLQAAKQTKVSASKSRFICIVLSRVYFPAVACWSLTIGLKSLLLIRFWPIFPHFCRKNRFFCNFFEKKFGSFSKSCTFALAKRNDAVGSLKFWYNKAKQIAEIAQLVEHNLAKVRVASSSLVFRSKKFEFVSTTDKSV